MNAKEIAKEYNKCKENPYYFATKYLTIKDAQGNIKPFTTIHSEKDFNNYFKRIKYATDQQDII